jgi:hypothetical protein
MLEKLKEIYCSLSDDWVYFAIVNVVAIFWAIIL